MKFAENIQVNTGSEIISRLRDYETKHDSITRLLTQKEKTIRELQLALDEASHKKDSESANHLRLLEKERALSAQYARDLTQERSRTAILSTEKECL